MATKPYTFKMDTKRDARLIAWLDGQPNASAAIREVLRAHVHGDVTPGQVYASLQRIERKLEQGVIAVPVPTDEDQAGGHDPELDEAHANLAALAGRGNGGT